MVKTVLFISSFVPLAFAQDAPKLKLSPKSVAEMVLKQSPEAAEIDFHYVEKRLAPTEVNANYDWKVSAEVDYEDDRTEYFYPFPNIPDSTFKRYYTTLDLTKSLPTGTTLSVDYTRVSQQANFNLNEPNPFGILPSLTQDLLGLTVQQSLLKNFFGRSDRARLRSADLGYQAEDYLRVQELQKLVLETLSAYWETYVAQESFREALGARQLYQNLVSQVRRKTGEGYGAPGEYAQAQAELEAQEQKIKVSSMEYLKQMENLVTVLKLPRETNIDFDVTTDLPTVPKLTPVQPDNLRVIKAQSLKVQAAQENLTVANSDSYPDVSLIAKAYTSGMDQDADSSLAAVAAGSHPKYFAGVKFAYPFGSGVQSERIVNKQAEKDAQETQLSREKMEQMDKLAQAERRAEAEHTIAESTKMQKDLRQKAVRELSRSYNMGRTDIRILIDAINSQYESEIGFWRAIGDYQIALNQWAALRDDLIPNEAIVKKAN